MTAVTAGTVLWWFAKAIALYVLVPVAAVAATIVGVLWWFFGGRHPGPRPRRWPGDTHRHDAPFQWVSDRRLDEMVANGEPLWQTPPHRPRKP